MRSDMHKVLVERPRLGSRMPGTRVETHLRRAGIPEDDNTSKRAIRELVNRKSLNEHLGPLRRFLNSSVGRPWDKVYSEICAGLDRRSATGLHILQHLFDYVDLDGSWQNRWCSFYVDAKSSLLRRRPRFRWPTIEKPVTRVELGCDVVAELRDGVWLRHQYRRRDPDEVVEVIRFREEYPDRNEQFGLHRPGDRKIVRVGDLPPSQRRAYVGTTHCSRDEIAAIEKIIRAKKSPGSDRGFRFLREVLQLQYVS